MAHSTQRIWDTVSEIADSTRHADGRVSDEDPRGVVEGRMTFWTREGERVMIHVRREE